ncbi:DUF2059 domain-containing protein [Lyngbya confervoides]|uniref:DUF2059 domain-containing protein n=1 Tax=Lyngbya confervoides BDU141951 TaxID=1574623 RepID=A0ABD4SZP6_9CYAN|nr:DUF2059 domain-containing protein [Lyngbya confervoides]MCM1981743.1 DUF2059 domain-containing protein [Lyngbya confervoides BDU141951]
MFKLKVSQILGLMLIFCLALMTVQTAKSQEIPQVADPSHLLAQSASKDMLAADVLRETGIAERYDMHFDHMMGMLIGDGNDSNLYSRLRKMFAQEIGWSQFQDVYIGRLKADFSEDELQDLLELSKQPVMKKLLQSEAQAYTDASARRFKMGYELWLNYNEGKISLPAAEN